MPRCLSRRPFLATALLAVALAACKPQAEKATGTPSPGASWARLSLSDALPSPTPAPALPSMPPPIFGAFAFYEDFEHGLARWRLEGGAGGVGWHLLNAATCGGQFTMVLGRKNNPEARFAPAEAYLTLKAPIALPKGRRLQLKYDVKGAVIPPEAARIEPQLRVGQGPWRPLGAAPTARFPLVVSYRVDLTPHAGQTVGLRFRGVTRATRNAHKGFYLDDIHLLQDEAP